jgi:hypothetical protein
MWMWERERYMRRQREEISTELLISPQINLLLLPEQGGIVRRRSGNNYLKWTSWKEQR